MVISAVESPTTVRARFPSPISIGLLDALRAAREGDFSVRLTPAGQGEDGRDRARVQRPPGPQRSDVGRARARRQDHRPRGTDDRTGQAPRRRWRVGDEHRLAQLADRRSRPADDRGRARDRRRRRGRPVAEDGAQDRRPAGQGRVPADRHDRQHDGRPAVGVRRRGHARRARSRHRGQARRPGRGTRASPEPGRT